MMRTFLSILAILGGAAIVQAQPYAIGSTNLTFTDPSRGGRAIPCEVYYPAATAGANVPVAAGAFPVLAMGHGSRCWPWGTAS
jgi:predicted dienelactone hydrolase